MILAWYSNDEDEIIRPGHMGEIDYKELWETWRLQPHLQQKTATNTLCK